MLERELNKSSCKCSLSGYGCQHHSLWHCSYPSRSSRSIFLWKGKEGGQGGRKDATQAENRVRRNYLNYNEFSWQTVKEIRKSCSVILFLSLLTDVNFPWTLSVNPFFFFFKLICCNVSICTWSTFWCFHCSKYKYILKLRYINVCSIWFTSFFSDCFVFCFFFILYFWVFLMPFSTVGTAAALF